MENQPVSTHHKEKQTPSVVMKQSRLGIVSFVIGVLALLSLILFFFPNLLRAINLPTPIYSFIDSLHGISFNCCIPLISAIGLYFGIACVVQRIYKKTFGIIGLVLNGIALLVILYIIVAIIQVFNEF